MMNVKALIIWLYIPTITLHKYLDFRALSNMQIKWTLEPVEPPMLGLHRPPFTASPQKEGVLLTSPKYFKSRVQNQKWQDGNMIVLWSFRCLQLECFRHFECSFCCLQLSHFDSIFDDCGFVHQTTASLNRHPAVFHESHSSWSF